MFLPKNIKIKDDNTDNMIKEQAHCRIANFFTRILTYKPRHCELCGFKIVIRHSYKESLI